jgi:hypothetical protein
MQCTAIEKKSKARTEKNTPDAGDGSGSGAGDAATNISCASTSTKRGSGKKTSAERKRLA